MNWIKTYINFIYKIYNYVLCTKFDDTSVTVTILLKIKNEKSWKICVHGSFKGKINYTVTLLSDHISFLVAWTVVCLYRGGCRDVGWRKHSNSFKQLGRLNKVFYPYFGWNVPTTLKIHPVRDESFIIKGRRNQVNFFVNKSTTQSDLRNAHYQTN